jgi:hypothetical protein
LFFRSIKFQKIKTAFVCGFFWFSGFVQKKQPAAAGFNIDKNKNGHKPEKHHRYMW